jgi:murein DD-endopeptidase MepM/ murein hydrolase activator NlpD
MKFLAIFLFSLSSLFSASVEFLSWRDGETFLGFLESEKLPFSLYYDADNDDKKLTEDITNNTKYYLLRDVEDGSVRQVLIPVGDEIQIHIYKSKEQYFMEAVPIEYQKIEEQFITEITHNSLYNNVKNMSNSDSLAKFIVKTLETSVNFKRIQRGSTLAVLYKRNYRLGVPFGDIDLKIAMLRTGSREKYVIKFDEKNYNFYGERLEQSGLALPIERKKYRISSRFTKKRWHPILKKYRAHLGIDYAARRGTPIYASGNGKVVFVGRTRGYGNLVKIQHNGGYLTLYAHMKRYRSDLRVGKKVIQGEFIGEVGSTGFSTGPHLHFGLYKNGVAINPEHLVSVKFKNRIDEKEMNRFSDVRGDYNRELQTLLRDYRSGRDDLISRYEPINFECETSIASIGIEEEEIFFEPEIERFTENEKPRRYINRYINPAPDSEYLELSEDYMEY